MNRRGVMVFLIGAAVVGCIWLWRLPTEETCSRTGRLVDPTHRHCVALDGSYVQLRSHAQMHATEGAWVLLLIGSAAFLVRIALRKMTGSRRVD